MVTKQARWLTEPVPWLIEPMKWLTGPAPWLIETSKVVDHWVKQARWLNVKPNKRGGWLLSQTSEVVFTNQPVVETSEVVSTNHLSGWFEGTLELANWLQTNMLTCTLVTYWLLLEKPARCLLGEPTPFVAWNKRNGCFIYNVSTHLWAILKGNSFMDSKLRSR